MNMTAGSGRERGPAAEFSVEESNATELLSAARRATKSTAQWEEKGSERCRAEADALML